MTRSGGKSNEFVIPGVCLAMATLAIGASPAQIHAESARILVFTRATGFRHASIEPAVAALLAVAPQYSLNLESSDDPALFTDASLAPFAAVVFLNTTGDLLDDAQQSAFERYIRAGGGFAGVHAAADAEYEWPWYGELLGAYFQSHPSIQWAGLTVEAPHAPSTAHLPPRWTRTDEWYNFRANPRDHVDVLLTIDESTYDGGAQGDDHPIAWRHEFQGGRAWYTAGGHTSESFNDPLFLTHVIGGILWAAGRRPDELDAPLALAVVASDDDSADAPTHSIDSVFADLCGAIGGAVGIAPLAILLFIGLPQHTRRCDRTPAAGARTRTR